MADAIYTFNRKNETAGRMLGFVPLKKPRNGSLDIREKIYNVRLRICRALIENVNARIKAWAVVGAKCRSYSTQPNARFDVNVVMHVVCALTNIRSRSAPFRKVDWDVKPGWERWKHAFIAKHETNRPEHVAILRSFETSGWADYINWLKSISGRIVDHEAE